MLPDGIKLVETRPKWDKSSPYLVLRASANLIPGHNEIYNKNFVKFLTGYLNLYSPGEAGRDADRRRS